MNASTAAMPRQGLARSAGANDATDALLWWALASFTTAMATFASLHATRQVIAASADPLLEALSRFLWLGGLAAPLVVALKGLLVATVIWSLLELLSQRRTYMDCLTAVFAAEIALAAATLLQAVVALSRTPVAAADLVVPIGLDVIWQPSAVGWAVLARAVTPFLVIWMAVVFTFLADGAPQQQRGRLVAAAAAGAAVVAALPLLSVL